MTFRIGRRDFITLLGGAAARRAGASSHQDATRRLSVRPWRPASQENILTGSPLAAPGRNRHTD
jgi:hypothetical protein